MRPDLYAIYGIWFREMLRFVRLRSRLIGSIGALFFFLAFLGMGFNTRGSGMSELSKGIDHISFLTPGIIGMTLCSPPLSPGSQFFGTGSSAFSKR